MDFYPQQHPQITRYNIRTSAFYPRPRDSLPRNLPVPCTKNLKQKLASYHLANSHLALYPYPVHPPCMKVVNPSHTSTATFISEPCLNDVNKPSIKWTANAGLLDVLNILNNLTFRTHFSISNINKR